MAEATAMEVETLILGGGFAGVYCARWLARSRRAGRGGTVGLVAAENYMVFQPLLAEVAAASLSPRQVINPLRLMCRGIRVIKGKITRIDAADRQVWVEAGDFTPTVGIRFRRLVVALGAAVDLSRVPGMSEHALVLQNVGDAMKLRSTVLARLEEANLTGDPSFRRRLLHFVVVGGGYSGVETAGELLDLLAHVRPFYENVGPSDYAVTLVHGQDHLLPTLHHRLGEYARRQLEQRGLRLCLNRRVRAVTAHGAVLDNLERLEAMTVISTIGNSPHPVVLDLAAQLNLPTERGRLATDAQLRMAGHPWLWAAGDCAAVPLPGGQPGEYCPATAQYAQRQGGLLGRNLLAEEAGRALRPFRYAGVGEMAAIGHRKAVAQIFGFALSGFPAWFVWRTVYLTKLPGLQRKLRVMVDWTFDLFFPRDINLLNPQYTRKLRTIHLEPGDVLFNPNEPAFSIYFVKEGKVAIHDGARLIKTVGAGDYFGERALLGDGLWHYRAEALTACTLVALGAPEFRAIVEGSSSLKRLFARSAQAYVTGEDMAAFRSQLHPGTLASTVADVMNRAIDGLAIDTPLDEALRFCKAQRHGSYPVLDKEGRLAGTMRRDDLFDFLKSHRPQDGLVRDLPIENTLPCVAPEMSVENLVETFTRAGKNKILVTTIDGRLEGLVTLLDLVEDSMRRSERLPESVPPVDKNGRVGQLPVP